MSKDNGLGIAPIVAATVIDQIGKRREAKQQKAAVTGRSKSDVDLEIYHAERKRKRRVTTGKVIGFSIAGYVVYRIGKKIVRNITDKDDSLEVQWAKRLRVAMSPSGVWWIPDGTNEKAVTQIAYEIADNPDIPYSKVQTAYKKLYGKQLSEHLEQELDTNEYSEFLKIVGPDYNPEKDRKRSDYFKYGKIVMILRDTSLFKDKHSVLESHELKKNGVFTNAVITGIEEPGNFWVGRKDRIEIKKVGVNETRWINKEDVGTFTGNIEMPMTEAIKNSLAKKGFKLYKM